MAWKYLRLYKLAAEKQKAPIMGLFALEYYPIRIISELLAEWTGLEPATPGVTGRYSNQLNYHSLIHNSFRKIYVFITLIYGGC